MNIHTEERNGVFTVRASRGANSENPIFVATASSRCKTEAYAAAVAKLNKKAAGVYSPIEIWPGFVA